MDLDNLLTHTGEWLKGKGEECDIIVSSRIRLARNLNTFPFLSQATDEQRIEVEQYISSAMKALDRFQSYIYLILDAISENDAGVLLERHLISKDHAAGHGRRSVFFKPDETVAIMLNEEDHLRMQGIRSGLALNPLWKEMDELDTLLERNLPYAFHKKFGYLTACPTNVGTGLRASVMLHLPALNLTHQMEKVMIGLSKQRILMRGLYGEGSTPSGDFFQLCNQVTLGKTEKEIISLVSGIVPQILKYEREVREKMLDRHSRSLKERIDGAYLALTNAEALSSEETMTHLSALRMGIHLGMFEMDIQKINELFLFSQPAHLQKKEGKNLSPEERDKLRVTLCKQYLCN